MVNELDYQNIVNEFNSCWMSHIYVFEPQLSYAY